LPKYLNLHQDLVFERKRQLSTGYRKNAYIVKNSLHYQTYPTFYIIVGYATKRNVWLYYFILFTHSSFTHAVSCSCTRHEQVKKYVNKTKPTYHSCDYKLYNMGTDLLLIVIKQFQLVTTHFRAKTKRDFIFLRPCR